jgi:hypothetical protein
LRPRTVCGPEGENQGKARNGDQPKQDQTGVVVDQSGEAVLFRHEPAVADQRQFEPVGDKDGQ